MRTRKSNRKKRFSYTQAFEVDSEGSLEEELGVGDADEDVDFQEIAAGAEEGHGSDEDDGINAGPRKGQALLADGRQGHKPNDKDGLVESDSDDEDDDDDDSVAATAQQTTGREHMLSKKVRRRAVAHIVPPYPTDLTLMRVYDGPMKRKPRAKRLLKLLYGPDDGHLQVVRAMLDKWYRNQILPGRRGGKSGVMQSPWLAEDYEEKQKRWSRVWYERYRAAKNDAQRSRKIRQDHVDMFKPPSHGLCAFLGPFDNQKQFRTTYGFGRPVADSGEPLDADGPSSNQSSSPCGWLLDTGGLPLSIGWAPVIGNKEQFLAVCTVPYSDQELKEEELEDAHEDDPEEKKRGSVQIWSIPCHRESSSHASLACSLWFDWGRAKRLQWCPVASSDESKLGLLAVLCGDGLVRVIEVPRTPGVQESYDWITSPVATLGFTDEYMVHASCLTWVNTNRVCLGHTDGSLSLWSVYPQKMLLRRSVHISQILDIASGFPSHPYHIATSPVGGSPALTDLDLPSAETTYIPSPGAVTFQPNLLEWNDHLQGFLNIDPSPIPHNTAIGWAHVRYFVSSKRLITNPSPPMCVAVGRTHPFALVGCADGSLWAFNPLRVLFRDKGDSAHKLRVLDHEFRPGAGAWGPRGAARVLQGFAPEHNHNPRPDFLQELERKKNLGPKTKSSSSRRRRKKAMAQPEPEEDAGDPDGDLEVDGMTRAEGLAVLQSLERTKAVVHHARTRVTMAAWNPNVEFGWWAAAAMGSGLVKVMDLGIEEASSSGDDGA